MITRNNPQIMKEWQAAGLTINGYTADDVFDYLVDLSHQTPDENEAKKMLILAIRATKQENGHTSGYVKSKLAAWLANGLSTADQVGEYERQRAAQVNTNRYGGRPLRQESSIKAPTSDEMTEQYKQLAAEHGYEDPQQWTKDMTAWLQERRVARASKNPVSTGRTATGQRVLQRF